MPILICQQCGRMFEVTPSRDVYKRQGFFNSESVVVCGCWLMGYRLHLQVLKMGQYFSPVSYTHLDVYKRQPRK